jgi:hypothetical protein
MQTPRASDICHTNIDVIENLNMIGDKADGGDQQVSAPIGGQFDD